MSGQTPPDARLPADGESPFGAFAPTPKQAFLINLARHVHLRGTVRKRCLNRLHRLRPGPVDVMTRSGKWRLYLTDNGCDKQLIIRQHRYEKSEINAIVGALGRENAVFVDVGANVGPYALPVAMRCPSARVVAFEPNPYLFRRLEFNMAANGVLNIHPHCLAVGDSHREGSLACDGVPDTWGLAEGNSGQIPVHIRPLADVLTGDETPVAVLKVDVEGHEDRVLLPFLEKTPRRDWPRMLVLEHICRQRWERDCLTWCLDEGYRVVFRNVFNAVLVRD